jgi:SAM-dependent methyltransferase
MPISSFSIVSLIACELTSRAPQTVLDLGCGSGFYGAVIYNFVDLVYKRMTRIIGVEPFKGYDNPNWRHYAMVYNKSIDAFLTLDNSNTYDMILFLDVIEHMTRDEGLKLIALLKHKLSYKGILLISTPGRFTPQDAEFGNELERHISFYTPDDFSQLGFIILKNGEIEDEFWQHMTVAKFQRYDSKR